MTDDELTALTSAIAGVIDGTPDQWVLVCADLDGRVHSVSSPGLPAWQRQGLLRWIGDAAAAQPDWTEVDEDDDE